MTLVRRFVLFAALAAAGCSPDDGGVKRYVVPPDTSADAAEVSADPKTAKSRLLGLVAPRGDDGYVFVKVAGDPASVTAAKPAFDKFVASMTFDDANRAKPVGYVLPEGWKEGKTNQFSVAAFSIPAPPAGEPLNVTISVAGGELNDNVKRWRGQIGLRPLPAAVAAKSYTEATVGGRKAYLIDLYGPNPAAGMAGPKMR